MSASLAIPDAHDVVSPVAMCESVELRLPYIDDTSALMDGRAKLLAIEKYLAMTSKVGNARIEATARRIEMRVGDVLGDSPHGGDRRSDQVSNVRLDRSMPRNSLHRLRMLAAHRDIVERVIADSDDTKPPSQNKALQAIRDHIDEQKETTVTGTDAREAVRSYAALGMSASRIAHEVGISGKRVYAIARAEGIALHGSQLAKSQRAPVIAEMAAAGHDSTQIAKAVGLSSDRVRSEARRLGIEIHADSIVGGTRHLDSVRIVRASVEAVNGIGVLFDQIDYSQLDPEDVAGWIPILEDSIRSLTTLKNQLKKGSQP